MSTPIPRVFLASSTNSLAVMQALSAVLTENKTMTVQEWTADTFVGYPLDDLLHATKECHYAVFVLWPDDELVMIKGTKRDPSVQTTRDNVIFEGGLFTGALERERAFYWANSRDTLRIPSDLNGLTQWRYTYDPTSSRSIDEQIQSDARKLRTHIEQHWKSTPSHKPLDHALLSCFKREWIVKPPSPPAVPFTSTGITGPRRRLRQFGCERQDSESRSCDNRQGHPLDLGSFSAAALLARE